MTSIQNKNLLEYKCLKCNNVHSEEEWNQVTYIQTLAGGEDEDPHWSSTEFFYPLSHEFDFGDGAWFICPSCKSHHDGADEIELITRQFKSNKEAVLLLEESW